MTITPAVFVTWAKALWDLRCELRDARAARKAKAHKARLDKLDAEDAIFIETGKLDQKP
jgi:hypothetical protein